jgi:acetyl-CoA acetyltransferase
MSNHDVAVLGVGMHPWGKWGRNFVEYGVAAAQDALRDAGIAWTDVQFVSGADTMRNGYPGYVSGATFAQALGWTGARVASSYAACASGVTALEAARTRILAGLCDVALVVGADTTPKGFLAPNAGDRPTDPDWLRFRLVGATNPTYFALAARRRMDLYGATVRGLRSGEGQERHQRPGQPERSLPEGRHGRRRAVEPGRRRPAAPPRDLRHLRRWRRDRAVLHGVRRPPRRLGRAAGRVSAVSTVTPTYPNTVIDLPDMATDSTAVVRRNERTFKQSIAHAAYEEAGIGPGDLSLAEVYDLSTALELDWYEDIGICEPGEAEKLLADGATEIGGRIPVNPSGGLACFGEAVPAQAIAQVCEVTWQLRGQATGRQVKGATAGITANQGLFGHGSSVLLRR